MLGTAKQHMKSPCLQDHSLGGSSFRLQNRSALLCPKAQRTHPGGPGSQRGGGLRVEIPTVSSEEASPVALETLAGVVLINHAWLLKQEDRAL